MTSSTRNFIPMQNKYDRVVLLVDMDCFYCQVEEKLDPTLAGKPIAVVQYNAWRGGGIIAVNYAARARGVTRHMRGDEAKEQCPDIQLVQVPNVREKADLTKYREAGKEVATVLQRFTPLLERASVDEAYLDITTSVNKKLEQMNDGSYVIEPHILEHTYAVGYDNIGDYIRKITDLISDPYKYDDAEVCKYDMSDVPAVRSSDLRLLIGAAIASEIRGAVKKVTAYECSAGIAHNKILAKLACGMNKPNKQTILPLAQIDKLFETLPLNKIKGLGAKYGEEVCERLNIKYVGQLLKYTEADLQRSFDEKHGTWLYNMGRGIDLEAVTPRFYSKSIGCCKKFPGRNCISGLKTLEHWLSELANEICDRLEKDIEENNRRAKQMVVSFIQDIDNEEVSSSRSTALTSYDKQAIVKSSLEVIKANTKSFLRAGSNGVLNNAIKFLGISVGKFETISSGQCKLQDMFANQAAKRKKSAGEATATAATDVQEAKRINANNFESKEDKQPATGTLKSYFQKQQQKAKEKIEPAKDSQSSEPALAEHKATAAAELQSVEDPAASSFFLQVLSRQAAARCNAEKERQIEPPKETEVDTELLQDEQQAVEDDGSESEVEIVDAESPKNEPIQIDDSPVADNENAAVAAHEQQSVEDDDNEAAVLAQKRKFSALLEEQPHSSTEPIADYQQTYAEYAIPVLRPELLPPPTVCEICQAKIPSDERSLQTHRDHHFAQELSQQQRSEYREQLKQEKSNTSVVISPKNSASKKSKTKKPVKAATNEANILRFLKSAQPEQKQMPAPAPAPEIVEEPCTSAQALTQVQVEYYICSECQLTLPKSAELEHQDYHLAKALQRELNQSQVLQVPSKANEKTKHMKATAGGGGGARKRPKVKPITQFFSQSQN